MHKHEKVKVKEIESGKQPSQWPFMLFVAVLVVVVSTVVVGLVNVTTAQSAQQVAAASGNCKPNGHRAIVDGTENQPAGISAAAKWRGITEPDANLTEDGEIMALHDNGLGRLTGGDSTQQLGNVTLAELRSFRHPFGKFRHTTALIARAAKENIGMMINLHRGGNWTNEAFDELYDAAQLHPRPQVVYFGGQGVVEQMVARHEDVATFHRFANDITDVDRMVTAINNKGYDLVGLRRPNWNRDTVSAIKATGAKVTSTQTTTKSEARNAQEAGVDYVQGNDVDKIAKRWCVKNP
jgi:glycerophosphoryl diester phosphodiesterase